MDVFLFGRWFASQHVKGTLKQGAQFLIGFLKNIYFSRFS
jgi:hypothetical protein